MSLFRASKKFKYNDVVLIESVKNYGYVLQNIYSFEAEIRRGVQRIVSNTRGHYNSKVVMGMIAHRCILKITQ